MLTTSNTTGATSGAGTAYPSGTPEFTPGSYWGSCYRYSIFVFCVMLCRSLFVLLSILFCPFSCLYFDLQILITRHLPFGIFKLSLQLFLGVTVNDNCYRLDCCIFHILPRRLSRDPLISDVVCLVRNDKTILFFRNHCITTLVHIMEI